MDVQVWPFRVTGEHSKAPMRPIAELRGPPLASSYNSDSILDLFLLLTLCLPLLLLQFSQFSSGAQLCPTLCDPMDYSTPGLPVHHQLLEFTQIHGH